MSKGQQRVPKQNDTGASAPAPTPIGREARTLKLETVGLLARLEEVYRGFFPERDPRTFYSDVVGPMIDGDADGDAMQRSMAEAFATPRAKRPTYYTVFTMVCAFTVQARLAEAAGKHGLGWSFAADASHYLGILLADLNALDHPPAPTETMRGYGKLGGAARTSKKAARRETIRKHFEGKLDEYAALTDMADDAEQIRLVDAARSTIATDLTALAVEWRRRGLWTGKD